MARGKRRKRGEAKPDPFSDRQPLTALQVGSLGAQGADLDSRRVEAMFVVVDPDDVPGLRNALKRQKAGHDFDVMTRCGGMIGGLDPSPVALIEIAIPEVGLCLGLAIEVDKYRHSLLEGIRTRRLMLMDSKRSLALQSMPPREALSEGLSMVVPLADVSPLMGLLQQRVDLPMPIYRPISVDLNETNRQEVATGFIDGAAVPDAVAVQYREADKPSIVIVDADLPSRPEPWSPETPLDGRWGSMAGNGKSVIRLDVFHKGEPFGSWLIMQPDPRIVRAGAAGSHHVMLMEEVLSKDQAEAERQWRAGISVWVEQVEALRALLKDLD